MEYLNGIPFYGDPCRVVECVMQEVKGPGVIADGDYDSLVAYSDTLARNFIRLENIGLEHEMSNTSFRSYQGQLKRNGKST